MKAWLDKVLPIELHVLITIFVIGLAVGYLLTVACYSISGPELLITITVHPHVCGDN